MSGHRIVYSAFYGKIPDNLQINHINGQKADNRLENLEAVTPSENTRHGYRVLGRKPVINAFPGVKNGRAKLTEEQVLEIRHLTTLGHTNKTLADRFGVSHGLISQVVNRQVWRHVP